MGSQLSGEYESESAFRLRRLQKTRLLLIAPINSTMQGTPS